MPQSRRDTPALIGTHALHHWLLLALKGVLSDRKTVFPGAMFCFSLGPGGTANAQSHKDFEEYGLERVVFRGAVDYFYSLRLWIF